MRSKKESRAAVVSPPILPRVYVMADDGRLYENAVPCGRWCGLDWSLDFRPDGYVYLDADAPLLIRADAADECLEVSRRLLACAGLEATVFPDLTFLYPGKRRFRCRVDILDRIPAELCEGFRWAWHPIGDGAVIFSFGHRWG